MTPDEQAFLRTYAETMFVSLIRPVASSLLHGVSIALFAYVAHLFWKKRMNGRAAQIIASAAVLCFSLTTANFVSSAVTITDQFWTLSTYAVPNPAKITIRIPTKAYDIYFITQYCILAISDFIVIWRSQALYPDRPTLYRIPGILFVGSIVCLLGAFVFEHRVPKWPFHRPDPMFRTVDVIGQALSLLTNIVTTIFVGTRIWSYRTWFMKHTEAANGGSFRQIQQKLLVLFETGALFCIVQLITVAYTIFVLIRVSRGLSCKNMCIFTHYILSRFRYVFAANYAIIVLALVHSKSSFTDTTYIGTTDVDDDEASKESEDEGIEMLPITKE